MHESGEYIKSTFFMEPDKRNPQGAGMVITYQRRYGISSVLGLNTDDDDDGNGSSKEATTVKSLTAEQYKKAINSDAKGIAAVLDSDYKLTQTQEKSLKEKFDKLTK
jgi:hypothetical protein